jgi:hypothetical protein
MLINILVSYKTPSINWNDRMNKNKMNTLCLYPALCCLRTEGCTNFYKVTNSHISNTKQYRTVQTGKQQQSNSFQVTTMLFLSDSLKRRPTDIYKKARGLQFVSMLLHIIYTKIGGSQVHKLYAMLCGGGYNNLLHS